MLVRIGKRISSPEIPFDEFFEMEFKATNSPTIDPSPSVYRVDVPENTQACTEHCAGNFLRIRNNNTGGRSTYDVDGIHIGCTVVSTPAPNFFSFVRQRHCELCFGDAEGVRDLAQKLFTEFQTRERPVTTQDMKKYVYERVTSADAEWLSYEKDPRIKQSWKKWIREALAGLPP